MNTPRILFENEAYLIIDKPAGWMSVPARDPESTVPVLSQWIRDHTPAKAAWVIHRLDRFTSGIMIFAKNEISQKEGNRWFEERTVKKVYHFLASPTPTRPAIQIKTPVDGKSAQTLFEIIEKGQNAFYGKATPLTGRFHQIREHAEVAGFPILGDKAYHGKPAPRVCLHAASLDTPIGKFEAPFPDDLKKLWEELK